MSEQAAQRRFEDEQRIFGGFDVAPPCWDTSRGGAACAHAGVVFLAADLWRSVEKWEV